MVGPHAISSDSRIGCDGVRRIRRIVARCIEIPEDALPPGARLVEDLGADRLDILQIAADLEREFALRIGSPEAAALRTVEDIAALIEERRGHRSS